MGFAGSLVFSGSPASVILVLVHSVRMPTFSVLNIYRTDISMHDKSVFSQEKEEQSEKERRNTI